MLAALNCLHLSGSSLGMVSQNKASAGSSESVLWYALNPFFTVEKSCQVIETFRETRPLAQSGGVFNEIVTQARCFEACFESCPEPILSISTSKVWAPR